MKVDPTPKLWRRFYKRNNYYHRSLQKIAAELIPDFASVVHFNSKGGELLASLPNQNKIGIEFDHKLLELAKKQYPKITFTTNKGFHKRLRSKKFDYILLSHTFTTLSDVQSFIKMIKKLCHSNSRIVVLSFNFAWKPLIDLADNLGLIYPQTSEPNWLSDDDIDTMFYLESYQKVRSGKRFIFPYYLPFISEIINKYIAQIPPLNLVCLTHYIVYQPEIHKNKAPSVSIIVPARNEAGNIKNIFKQIPKLHRKMELIFIEGHSKDKTYETIKKCLSAYKGFLKVKLFRQKGIGKGDAVRLGFSKARHKLLIILDADLTVDPSELKKFYDAFITNRGSLIMGSRLIYPMEKQAMRILNYIGNKFFALAFSFLIGQRIKDTLCGTKAIYKSDYLNIEKNRHYFGDFDPFGDFDLIFGAAKLNLKITEIPIRYKERTYGKTNISRFKHGLLLLRMILFAARKLKFT